MTPPPSSCASARPASPSGTVSSTGPRWRTRPGATTSAGTQITAGSTVAPPASGSTSARCSTPFCSATTTVPGPASSASHGAAPAVWWALTASSTQSARPPAGSVTSGEESACGGSPSRSTVSRSTGVRAHSTSPWPARSSAAANVTPIAPVPTTAMRIALRP